MFSRRTCWFSIGLALLWGGLASAGMPSSAPDASLQSELAQVASYSDTQKRELVTQTLALLTDAVGDVTKLYDNAKKQGASDDNLTCLAARLASLNTLKAQVQNLKGVVEAALADPARSDSSVAHNMYLVVSAKNNGQKMHNEAYSCSGDETQTTTETAVAVNEPVYLEGIDLPSDDFNDVADLPGEPGEETPFAPAAAGEGAGTASRRPR